MRMLLHPLRQSPELFFGNLSVRDYAAKYCVKSLEIGRCLIVELLRPQPLAKPHNVFSFFRIEYPVA